ncbi:hypothetical protein [Bradyrhizobium hipponense]|uniref:hypothetical protein n=1 Tax=Bradyrhizobium hipponense TaxID=2605638 RepID=UPI001F294ECC|nr:hypothetical protein [Bradyrhizobium hipponense]
MDVDWSDAVLVIPPKKKAISIRVDEDVFESSSARARAISAVNAALRPYMQQKTGSARNDAVGPSLDSRFAPFDLQALIAAT